jgi:hypothetical protein
MIARAGVLVLALTATVAAARPGTLMPQQPAARLTGRITRSDGLPGAGAEILVTARPLQTLAASDGTYELRDIPAGPQRIEVKLIGHRTISLELDFETGAVVHRDLQLELEPIALDGVEARASNPVSPALQGFNERRERGGGYFYSRDEITRMQARQFTDVLRRVPGATLQPVNGPFGTSYVLQLSRTSGITPLCPVLYYMNGTPFPVGADNSINNFVVPDDVAGVEVYTGASRVPSQFNSGPQNSRCGVVVIWTFNGRGRPGF